MFQESKEKPELRNADIAREERRERMSAMTNSDGSKKPLRKKRSKAALITILVLCALIIGMIVWAVFSLGILNRYQKAFTVSYKADAASGKQGSKTYTLAEANFFAGLIRDQRFPNGLFSPEAQAALDEQTLTSDTSAEETTTDTTTSETAEESTESTTAAISERDKLIEEVKRQLVLDFVLEQEKGDQELPDQTERIDTLMKSMKERAASEKLSLSNYLANHYGKGMNEKTFRNIFKHLLDVSSIQSEKYKSFTYDEATLQAKYDEDPSKYDVVSYRFYSYSPDDKDAEKKAEEFNSKVTDEESFKSLAAESDAKISEEKGEEAPAQDPSLDTTLASDQRSKYIEPAVMDWLFSKDRQANDHTVIKTTNGLYQVVMFLERHQPQDPSYDSRHILLKVDPEATEEEQAKVKENIEKLKAEFEAGDRTEESFAELASKNSEDPGSSNNGGLYAGIKKGQFVPEYEEWCLDENRQSGDVEIIKSTYGYHLIYFVKTNGPEWQDLVSSELRDADFRAWLESAEQEVEVVDAGNGNKVGR